MTHSERGEPLHVDTSAVFCENEISFFPPVPLGLLARYLNIIVALDKVLKAELLQGCGNMTEPCYDPPLIMGIQYM